MAEYWDCLNLDFQDYRINMMKRDRRQNIL